MSENEFVIALQLLFDKALDNKFVENQIEGLIALAYEEWYEENFFTEELVEGD